VVHQRRHQQVVALADRRDLVAGEDPERAVEQVEHLRRLLVEVRRRAVDARAERGPDDVHDPAGLVGVGDQPGLVRRVTEPLGTGATGQDCGLVCVHAHLTRRPP